MDAVLAESEFAALREGCRERECELEEMHERLRLEEQILNLEAEVAQAQDELEAAAGDEPEFEDESDVWAECERLGLDPQRLGGGPAVRGIIQGHSAIRKALEALVGDGGGPRLRLLFAAWSREVADAAAQRSQEELEELQRSHSSRATRERELEVEVAHMRFQHLTVCNRSQELEAEAEQQARDDANELRLRELEVERTGHQERYAAVARRSSELVHEVAVARGWNWRDLPAAGEIFAAEGQVERFHDAHGEASEQLLWLEDSEESTMREWAHHLQHTELEVEELQGLCAAALDRRRETRQRAEATRDEAVAFQDACRLRVQSNYEHLAGVEGEVVEVLVTYRESCLLRNAYENELQAAQRESNKLECHLLERLQRFAREDGQLGRAMTELGSKMHDQRRRAEFWRSECAARLERDSERMGQLESQHQEFCLETLCARARVEETEAEADRERLAEVDATAQCKELVQELSELNAESRSTVVRDAESDELHGFWQLVDALLHLSAGRDLQGSMRDKAVSAMERLTPEALSGCALAFAAAAVQDHGLLAALAVAVRTSASDLSALGLAITQRSLVVLGCLDEATRCAIATAALQRVSFGDGA